MKNLDLYWFTCTVCLPNAHAPGNDFPINQI